MLHFCKECKNVARIEGPILSQNMIQIR